MQASAYSHRPWAAGSREAGGRPSAHLASRGSLPLLPSALQQTRHLEAAQPEEIPPAQCPSRGWEPGGGSCLADVHSPCPPRPSLWGSATPCCSACSEGLRLGAPGAPSVSLQAGGPPGCCSCLSPHCSTTPPGAASSLAGSRGLRAKPFLFLPVPER